MSGSARDDPHEFLRFVSRALPHSYAQRFQDLFGLWESGFSPSGFFVEFGALNGRDFSNSYLMEQLGWDGIVDEPHPDYSQGLREIRRCHVFTECVYDVSGEIVTFQAVRNRPWLSVIEGFGTQDSRAEFRRDYVAHEIRTITLNDMLELAGDPAVDFLSVDTEGSETTILRAFDFGAHPIRAIAVEHNQHQQAELYDLLTSNGFRRKWPELSGHDDDWYVRDDLSPADWSLEASDALAEAWGRIPPFEQSLDERSALLTRLAAGGL